MKFRKDNIKANKQEALESNSFKKTEDSLLNLDTLNYNILKNKYNAIGLDFDTVNFTYEIEDRIKSSKRPIILEARLIDIVNQKGFNLNSNYEIENNDKYKIIANHEHQNWPQKINMKLVIDINKKLFYKLMVIINERKNYLKNSRYIYFLVAPQSISSLSTDLDAKIGFDKNESEIFRRTEEMFVKLEGKLIDFYFPNEGGLYITNKSLSDGMVDLAK